MSDNWPAGRSVLWKKSVTAVLKMLAALALRPRAAFSTGLISQFFAIRTDPEPFLIGIQVGLFTQLCHLIGLPNRFISNYFMIVAFSSTVKFSKIVFSVWNFVQSLKYSVLRTKITTVSHCESLDLRLFLPQTEYQTAWKSVNLQKGSGKKTRLKSFFT